MTDMDYNWDFFIGYAGPDQKHALVLYEQLLPRCEVFVDVKCLRPGDCWDEEIPSAQQSARITVLLISSRTEKAYYQKEEIAQAIALSRQDKNRHRVVPVYLNDPNDCEVSIPYGLRRLVYCRVSEKCSLVDIGEKLLDLLSRLKKCKIDHPSVRIGEGIGGRDAVFREPEKLPDYRAFAAELLTCPIILSRRDAGRTRVTISRRGVQEAVYTTAGKNWLCDSFLKGKIRIWAEEKDAELHNFLIGNDSRMEYRLPLHNFPLRWASGGVLSVVRIRGKRGLWTPFFFRDIGPIGWNISLGASEAESELNNPSSLLVREFLEETLVLPDKPGSIASRNVKTFVIMPDPVSGFIKERRQAEHFIDTHIALRNQTDNLALCLGNAQIVCEHERTSTELEILGREGNPQHPPVWRDVLMCFNLLELGIEVVTVLEYELDENDYLLDGEVLDRQDSKTGEKWKELVRMPIALISHQFLERVLGAPDFLMNYHHPRIIPMEGNTAKPVLEPSHAPDEIPGKDEIIIFPWDVDKRVAVAENSESLDIHKSDRKAVRRHKYWVNNFASYFLDDYGRPTTSNPIPWFTPASAKIMSYYFANRRLSGS